MKRLLHLIILLGLCTTVQAQHTFRSTSLSEALIELDKSSKHYDISFVYDELEDFTVTKTVRRSHSLPNAVREVCGFYPVRVTVKGRDILVECIQKDRTKLTGRLVGPDRQPVVYANITLFPLSDSTYIGGGVSNEAGDFVIPCGAERAKVRISCVGFRTIERVMPISDVGTIHMQMENNYLSNVNVSGRMPVIRNEADRLQYLVSNDEFAHGFSVEELLCRVPMVSMVGGHAMILGKGPAHFMLNGHITEMGDEAIRQKLWTMRSEDIDRIEVISIPSGRDIMEMGGGYINIVLRHDQSIGWRGEVSAEAGMSNDWSGRACGSASYVSEKFDMTIDAHGGRATQTTDELMTYSFQSLNDPTYIYSDTRTQQTDKELATSVTLHYQPVKQLELGGMLSFLALWPDKEIEGHTYNPAGDYTLSEVEQSPDGRVGSLSLMAYCDWRLDPKGKLLSLTYQNYKKDDDSRSYATSTTTQTDIPTLYNYMGNTCEADYHIQSARLDLTLPFTFISLDAGVSYTSIRNQAHPSYSSEGPYIPLLTQEWAYDYHEKTKAAYVSIHRDWKQFSMKAGLRYEHIDLDGETEYNSGNPNELNNTHFDRLPSRNYWLPSFSLSFKPMDGHQLSFIYGASCIRPNFYELNPFHIYRTIHERSSGTPELQPSRTSSMELSYNGPKGLYVCAFHHHSSNSVEPFIYATNYGTFANFHAWTTPQNIGQSDQTGLSLRYQRPLTRDLLATAEGEVYYHDTKDDSSFRLHGWAGRMAISADWYLNRQHTLLLNARYQHWFADYHGLTRTDGYGYFHFALRYSLPNERLKLSLVAIDPFCQYVTDKTNLNCQANLEYSSLGSFCNLEYFSHINHHACRVSLTATYSFGDKKVRRARHDLNDTESQRAQKRE